MSIRTQWIGPGGAAFERVGLAFEQLGYRKPHPDSGASSGAYASNIAQQYAADLSEREALAIVNYGLRSSRRALQHGYKPTLREIVGNYSE